MSLYACAVIGPKITRFPFKYKESCADCRKMKSVLSKILKNLYQDGVRRYITSATLGVGLWTAEAVLQMKRDGCRDVELIVFAPFPDNHLVWDSNKQNRLMAVQQKCNSFKVVSERQTPDCIRRCQYGMVESCDILVAIFDGNWSERTITGQVINYSRNLGRDVVCIHPESAVIFRDEGAIRTKKTPPSLAQ